MEKTIIDYFISLVTIDSESKSEKQIAEKLQKDLTSLGAEVRFDNAHHTTGGDVGNLYAFFKGDQKKTPLLLCAHMDTVQPGKKIRPQILEDKISSDGKTILGADDKSGIAQIIWAIHELKKNSEKHAPLEILFTISEEIGLLGAKYVDYTLLSAKTGFALDGHDVGSIAIGAPSQNSLHYTFYGREAHAGVEPEKGINAIKIAAEAISKMPSGRIDEETTCNIGLIQGGKATNIVPNKVEIKAEARSHDSTKLKNITERLNEIIQSTAEKNGIRADIRVTEEYKAFRLNQEDEAVLLAKQASQSLKMNFDTYVGGGGSDVNIFNQNGLRMAVAGTGMAKVHTLNEFINIADLENGARWIKEVIRIYSGK